jgi:tripartite-type tricarboxylate transporter receptor subunit TctC
MAAVVWCLSGSYAGSLVAQPGATSFPNRPIELFIGSAPSGSTDALGRVLARALEEELGQTVVVHNTPGAGGAVMATQLRSSVPDGYSIGMNISHAYTGNPVVMPDVTPYSVSDFTHLASVSKGQCALVTSTQKPYRSFDDLIAAARAGDQPVFASQSPLTRIVVDYISQADDVSFRVMTVQGGGEIMQSVLGGHADFGFSGGPHISFVEAGQMRVLASVEDARLLSSPDVPTLKELGYDVSSCATFVVSAPAGLPADIKDILATALRQAIGSAPMQSLIRNLKYPQYFLGPDEVTRALENEAAMLERAVIRIDAIANGNGSTQVSIFFMPIVALGIGFIGIVFLLGESVRNIAAHPREPVLSRHSWLFVASSIAVMLAGFLIMLLLGYLPGAAAIVCGFMILSRARLRYVIGCAVALPVALWLLFSKLLGFPLP